MYNTGAPRNWVDLRSEQRTVIIVVGPSYSSAVGLPHPQGIIHWFISYTWWCISSNLTQPYNVNKTNMCGMPMRGCIEMRRYAIKSAGSENCVTLQMASVFNLSMWNCKWQGAVISEVDEGGGGRVEGRAKEMYIEIQGGLNVTAQTVKVITATTNYSLYLALPLGWKQSVGEGVGPIKLKEYASWCFWLNIHSCL